MQLCCPHECSYIIKEQAVQLQFGLSQVFNISLNTCMLIAPFISLFNEFHMCGAVGHKMRMCFDHTEFC